MSPISRTALSAAAAVLALTLTARSSGELQDADKQSADDAQTQESTEESSEAAGSKGNPDPPRLARP